MGGLALETTQCKINFLKKDSLKKYFEKFGELSDSILMIDKMNNKSRGFGFITMKDPSKTEEILKNQPHYIDGKLVDCKIAIPKENIPQPTEKNGSIGINDSNPGNSHNPKKIFVGGLPSTLKDGNDLIFLLAFR